MLPGRCDVALLRIAAQSFYETLMEAGVEIYERQGVVLHAKTMCVDNEVSLLGSTNLDYRSIEYNCEISAVIRSRIFGHQMPEMFENDVRYARQIRLSEWRRGPGATDWASGRSAGRGICFDRSVRVAVRHRRRREGGAFARPGC